MRIDLYSSTAGQIASEQSAQQVATQNTGNSGQPVGEDTATLTTDSTSVSSLASTAMNSPEVRQNLVDSLKQSIANGSYELNPTAIASSMVDEQA
jgi:flagellar biosynthesis anti-sigma factor FlgM